MLQDYLEDGDDFLGDSIDAKWRDTGDVGGGISVIDGGTGGRVRITTGGVNTNSWRMDWSDIRSLLASKNVILEVYAKLNQATFVRAQFTLYFNASNRIALRFFEDVGGVANWAIYTEDGGGSVSRDSGVQGDTNPHIFRIECSATSIRYYIDGVECANSPLTTNITVQYLQPYLWLQTRENLAKTMDIDYAWWRQER